MNAESYASQVMLDLKKKSKCTHRMQKLIQQYYSPKM